VHNQLSTTRWHCVLKQRQKKITVRNLNG